MNVLWAVLAGSCTIMSILCFVAFQMRKAALKRVKPEGLESLVKIMVVTVKMLNAIASAAIWLALLAIVLSLWL